MSLFSYKKGQISLEFSLLILIILLLATISYYNFIDTNINKDYQTIDKINIRSAKAVSLVSSRVNGTYAKYISYLGMNYSDDKKNIRVVIKCNPRPLDSHTRNFINKTICENIDLSTYNVNITYVE